MRTVLTKPSIAAATATANIASALATNAQRAERKHRRVAGFAIRIAGGVIGIAARVSGTSAESPTTRPANWLSSMGSAASAADAETPTRACLTLTTSTPRKSCDQSTGITQRRSVCSYGKKKLETFRFFARTAIASKLARIALKRIDEAYRQPRLFKDEAPRPKQEALL